MNADTLLEFSKKENFFNAIQCSAKENINIDKIFEIMINEIEKLDFVQKLYESKIKLVQDKNKIENKNICC